MTVGELRAHLSGVPDDWPIEVSILLAPKKEVNTEVAKVIARGMNVFCQDAFCILCDARGQEDAERAVAGQASMEAK